MFCLQNGVVVTIVDSVCTVSTVSTGSTGSSVSTGSLLVVSIIGRVVASGSQTKIKI